MNKLLLILLIFTQSLMATPKDKTVGFGVMVATCGICEKRQKELEEQTLKEQDDPLLQNEPNDSIESLETEARNTKTPLPQSVISQIAQSFYPKTKTNNTK